MGGVDVVSLDRAEFFLTLSSLQFSKALDFDMIVLSKEKLFASSLREGTCTK